MTIASPSCELPIIDGVDRLRRAILEAANLAGQVERGQAQVPLRDHFAALAGSLDSGPFTLTLLGLDAESRASALSWLCGVAAHVLTLNVSGTAGLVEVQLALRGYVLVKAGLRQEFDRMEPFLEAVRAADLVRRGDADAWLEPLHLEVAAPRGLQGMRLLMPESLAALAENSGLQARLRTEANVLAVAGPADRELNESEAGAIRELATDALATWVIVRGAALPGGVPIPGWPALLGGGTLPMARLEPDAPPPPLPPFLLDDRSGVRRGLFACQQARRFEAAVDMIEERVRQDTRQQESRRKALMRRSTSLGDPAQERALREEVDAIRRTVGDGLARLEAQLAEANRERLLPSAVAANRIANYLEDLAEEDIGREESGRVIQLRAAADTLKKAERLVRDLAHAALHEDLERFGSVREALAREAGARLDEVGGGEPMPPAAALDESAAWDVLAKSIHLDTRYRGELIEKGGAEGLFEWAMHGRRPVFLLMMLSSLGIPFLSDLKNQLGPLMVLVFGGGLYWAWHSARTEKREKMERELVRLREALLSEVRTLYEQALRDWQARGAQYLREVGKAYERAAESRLRARLVELNTRSTRERAEIQDKLKVVDQRLRELSGLTQQVGRVRQSAAEARTALERAARDALAAQRQTDGGA